ncbi:pre T-cell antigen receptor alpha isoform X2 [Symphalangus syndactylus]|uniref:pre T-cell antigen receptor alpha isoform X2 n=1 Tax=Symphalangus syndactylus TaxID=9590 RepID=UPI0030077E7C
MEDRYLIEERMDKQVWAAHSFLLWPHQSCCWWMESGRWWWSAWSLMLHPLALTTLSGSQPAMAVHWMPSPMALPQQRMAPGPTWPISPCLLRSWHPGSLWSATPGLGLRATAGVHSPCSCQGLGIALGMPSRVHGPSPKTHSLLLGQQERLLQPGPAPGSLSGAPAAPEWFLLAGTPGGALWLGVLRLLLFKLLLFDLLLTCSCLRDPAGPPPSPAATTRLRALGSHRLHLATETGRREATSSPRPQPRDRRWGDTPPGRKPGSPVWEEGSYLSSYPTCPAWAWCSRSALRTPSSSLGAFFAGDLPPPLQAGAA